MIVRRGALTDHYVEGERSVVMVEESVLGLSPIATAILEAVPDGTEVDVQSVAAHVVAAFGQPEGSISAEDLTREQVWDLVAHKVLVIVEDEGSRDGTPSLPERRSGSSLPGRRIEDFESDPRAAGVTAVRDALRHLRSTADGSWSLPAPVPAPAFVAAARQHHVVPYLAANLERLDLPAQARSELEAAAGRQRAGAAMLAADLSVALDAMTAASVRALAFKGVALAAQAYGDFTIRGAGDLDLLVSPKDLASAHRALTGAGWRPAGGYPTPGPSWGWRHFVRTGSELTLTATHSDVDLHWHLVPTRDTFPDFDTLWSRRQTVSVAGHPVATLAPYDALAHSAGHAAKDRWRWMRSLVDVHTLMANQDTWLGADRPLRRDQLLSVGLAVREFGTIDGMPPIVSRTGREIEAALIERVHYDQEHTAANHRVHPVPGVNFLFGLVAATRTNRSPREAVRLLSRSALPPWLTRDESSHRAWVAAPRVLARRARDAIARTAN